MDAKVVTAPTELLPCPFCGAAAERREYDHRHPYEPFGLVAAHLEDCFLNLLRDEEAMYTAWDTRPIEDDLSASRDRASDACASVQRERDALREMLELLRGVDIVETCDEFGWKLQFEFGDGHEANGRMWEISDAITSMLSRYEGEVK